MKNRKQLRSLVLLVMLVFLSSELISQEKELNPEKSVVRTLNDKDMKWGPCPEFMPEGCEIAILNGDPSKDNVDVFFKVPANSKIPNHAHTSAERMILVSGELEVTYEGEASQLLREGSYAYGPAKKAHTANCGNAGPCVLYIAFEEPLDAYAVKD